MDDKQRIMQIIEDKRGEFIEAADRIWRTPETRFDVGESVKPHYEILEREGFSIDKGVAHMDHAYVASWGSGRPVIGITGEYDALDGLSQVADLGEHQPLVPGGAGQGCGHNILGMGAVAAGVGIKTFMEEWGLHGTIKVFGCPAEESGYGKAFMARDGVFDGLDAAFSWHPMDVTSAWGSSSLAVIQSYFEFKGTPAHAAAAPELGRSALDAAELMNTGVQYLREHMIDEARIHYAFIDAGGESANVVQSRAKLYYFVRAPRMEQAQALYERVKKVGHGAAMMTETELNIELNAACYNYMPNKPLTRAIDRNLDLVGPLPLTQDELDYERRYTDTVSGAGKQSVWARNRAAFPDLTDQEVTELSESSMMLRKMPLVFSPKASGSTDVGDVSWQTPTAQFTGGFEPQGTSPHSWQWVANGKSSVAHKGLLMAGKTLALSVYDTLTDPELLIQAQADFKASMGQETYRPVLPSDLLPS
ncbi:amidohydrolase [Bifidobacterium aemilianum]|uniref:Amidohydrolase n=1 Tax=Bifidobacterium aemilianum TaxID=2493120 RepID=A0A366KA11_9BIFI|nr:amidohydrolase [Bifidobacterium aemilianum]RBP98585.1 amidohydrolase [Bifidobacterium aemilianum]